MAGVVLLLVCLLISIECKRYIRRDDDEPIRPDHTKLVPMARYLLHNAEFASLATISTISVIRGYPYASIEPMVDGTLTHSTGVPYFYLSVFDLFADDLKKNKRASVLVVLQDLKYCEEQKTDTENARCNRLMLSGRMRKVRKSSEEYDFAKAALFERHPALTEFVRDRMRFIVKLKITAIALINRYGAVRYVPTDEYLTYKYSGTEMIEFDSKLRKKIQDF